MTRLTKPVRRTSDATVRDGRKRRELVITLYPGGFMGLRMAKCRTEETIPLDTVYCLAVKLRVQSERKQKGKR